MQDWFKARNIWGASIDALSDDEAGRLAKAVWAYTMRGEMRELSGAVGAVFALILMTLQQDERMMPKGENHWNWKGGITPQNQKERNSTQYKQWRDAVFARDNYTCQSCGQRGGRLNAHHISAWAKDKDRRLDISNGITLCSCCHRAIHSRRTHEK